ncbi:MAG: peptide ABC transporter substrate-binding protein [Chloroflexi bacterium]|nr:peptide ABC transporter substrate-binding protein [Chloroflexota bacterium]
MGKKILLLTLCFLSLALTVTACGGTPAGGHGTLNLADSGPITLDPAVAAEFSSAMYIVQIFSGLVRLDENLQIVPDIAERWEESADGKTFTFHLRQDVKFHNGKAVKASDFKYSWERALNPATNSLTAGTYLNDIVGAADVLSGKSTHLSGVKVIDEYAIQVTIDAPKTYFLQKMAFPTAFVVDKTNVQSGSAWWLHPNGTGPFKLKQWQQDQLLVLRRNDNYYGDKAKLKQVVFELFSGNSMQLYQEGSIDVSSVSSDYMGLVTDPSNPVSKELATYPELSLSYIGFNASAPPFDDVNIRLAFSHAVDKERLISLSAQNVVPTAYGILPPGMPGYDANLLGLRFDPQKARELVAASKYGKVSNLPPIVLTISGWGGDISGVLGGVIEEWRRNLGIEVNVRQLEPEPFLYALNQEKDELFSGGWIADYPDPQNFLDVLFHTAAQNNTGGYSNPQLDLLLGRASIEQDMNVRLKLYQDAEQIVVQDAAVLPLFFGRNYVLVKPYVKDYVLSPLGYPLLNKVSIQK